MLQVGVLIVVVAPELKVKTSAGTQSTEILHETLTNVNIFDLDDFDFFGSGSKLRLCKFAKLKLWIKEHRKT